MELHINEINSIVRAADSRNLLDPQILEQVVELVIARMREAQEYEQRVDAERSITSSSADEPSMTGR